MKKKKKKVGKLMGDSTTQAALIKVKKENRKPTPIRHNDLKTSFKKTNKQKMN
jgi:hypothetical protein